MQQVLPVRLLGDSNMTSDSAQLAVHTVVDVEKVDVDRQVSTVVNVIVIAVVNVLEAGNRK